MKPQIPSNVVGYILTSDYCEIQLPNGHGIAFKRQHPVRGPDGQYAQGAEWSGMFQSRMRQVIKSHGFPILHEQGMKPMSVVSTQEPTLEEIAYNQQLDVPEAQPPANHLCPTCAQISKERFPNRRPTEPGEYCDACGAVAQPPTKREPTQQEWEEAMDKATEAFNETHQFPDQAWEGDRCDWIDDKTLQILRDKGLSVD